MKESFRQKLLVELGYKKPTNQYASTAGMALAVYVPDAVRASMKEEDRVDLIKRSRGSCTVSIDEAISRFGASNPYVRSNGIGEQKEVWIDWPQHYWMEFK